VGDGKATAKRFRSSKFYLESLHYKFITIALQRANRFFDLIVVLIISKGELK
jgi:hypothetical protein